MQACLPADSSYNYQEFFQSIVDNETDFRTIAIHFMKILVEKEDSRAAEILKQEIVKRLKNTNLVDLMRLLSPKGLEAFTNEELRLISFNSLEKEPFLKKCGENSSIFTFVFSLVKSFIERGFEQEKNLLKNIFIREFDKPDSYLLRRLIASGYLDLLNGNDKEEMVGHLIKTGNLNVFLELNNKNCINLVDFQNDLLTANSELNKRLKGAFENPDQIRKFACPLLEWFSKNGTEEAQKFFDTQITKWIKSGCPETISFLKENYSLREYFQNDTIARFINDEESHFIKNVSIGLIHQSHYVRKTCFELFETSLAHLDQTQRKMFIDRFVGKIQYRGKEIPDTAFQGIQGLLILGAFDRIRNLLTFKGYCEEHGLDRINNQLNRYNLFPPTYRSLYDNYEDEYEYTYRALQPLIIFLDSREINSSLHINDDEFNVLHKFITISSEIIAPNYVLKNFPPTTIYRLADYLIDKLNEETNPQSFVKILEFIQYYVISLEQLKAEEFFFRIISSYKNFKKANEKYNFNGIFIDYLFQIRQTLGDRFLPALLKLFNEGISVLCSYFYESLNPECDMSDDMRNMALKVLVLLLKSKNQETVSLLIKEQILISLEDEWLYKVFNEMEKADVEYFLFGVSQVSKIDGRFYQHYEYTSDETFLINIFKKSLKTRKTEEQSRFVSDIIELVVSKFTGLFQFLVEAEFFEEISTNEFQRLLTNPDKLFYKSLLAYIKKNLWDSEDFDTFYDQVTPDNSTVSNKKKIHELHKFYLEMLHQFNTETYNVTPPIQLLKKFGEGAVD